MSWSVECGGCGSRGTPGRSGRTWRLDLLEADCLRGVGRWNVDRDCYSRVNPATRFRRSTHGYSDFIVPGQDLCRCPRLSVSASRASWRRPVQTRVSSQDQRRRYIHNCRGAQLSHGLAPEAYRPRTRPRQVQRARLPSATRAVCSVCKRQNRHPRARLAMHRHPASGLRRRRWGLRGLQLRRRKAPRGCARLEFGLLGQSVCRMR